MSAHAGGEGSSSGESYDEIDGKITETKEFLGYGTKAADEGGRSVISDEVLNSSEVLAGGGQKKPIPPESPTKLTPEAFSPCVDEAVQELKGKFKAVARAKNRFDKVDWAVEDDPDYEKKLVGIGKVIPSEWLERLVKNDPDYWWLDCAEWVQVVQLLARLRYLGPTEFNKRLGERIELREHGSWGLKQKKEWRRDSLSDPSIDPVLAKAPLGSRVMWSNYWVDDREIARNQNAIKLGHDRYGLHLRVDENEFTRAVIMEEMLKEARNGARRAGAELTDDELKKGIWLSQIEVLELP